MNWEEGKKGFENYLKLEKSLSQNSVAAYVNDISKLIVFLDKNYSKVTPLKVKLEHLKGFIEWLNEREISPRTQARTISGIKSFYKYLLIEGKLTSDPTALIESPKIGRKLPDVLSMEEIDSLIDAVDLSKSEGQRNKAMLETLYSCGLRVSELVNLKITNLFFEQGFIKVEGKAGKERLVPVSGKAIEEVQKYLSEYRKKTEDCKRQRKYPVFKSQGKKTEQSYDFYNH